MLDTDVGAVRWITPLRVAVVTAGAVGVMMSMGLGAESVNVGIAALVAGLADQRGAIASRVKGMAWMTAWVTVAAMFGVLMSQNPTVRVVSTVLVAFACGYAARMGPRATVIGMVTLVVFTVFSGIPAADDLAVPSGLWILLGGALQIVAVIALQFVSRTGGVRTDICVAWRSAGHSLRRSRIRYGATSPMVKLQAARSSVAALRADPAVTGAFQGLIVAQQRFGVGGIIVLSAPFTGTPAERAALDRFVAAAADLAIAIGHAVESPWRAARMNRAFTAMEAAADGCAGVTDARMMSGVREMREGMGAAVQIIRAGIPRGSVRSVSFGMTTNVDPMKALLGRPTFDDVILRHAFRLAIATGAATLIVAAFDLPVGYWALPMTVAWVLRPDFGGTGVRVTARFIGTIAGLFIADAVLVLAGAGEIPVLILIFLGAILACGFIGPNYAVSTTGATAVFVALFSYLGQPLVQSFTIFVWSTVIAGALAIAVTVLIKARDPEVLCGALAHLADDVSRYADLVRRAGPRDERSAALEGLATTRVTAGRVVESATQEARVHRIHPERADRIMRDLVEVMAIVAAEDLRDDDRAAPAVPERVVHDSADLARRLHARQDDQPVPPRALAPAAPGDDDAILALDDAQVTFQQALGERAPLVR